MDDFWSLLILFGFIVYSVVCIKVTIIDPFRDLRSRAANENRDGDGI